MQSVVQQHTLYHRNLTGHTCILLPGNPSSHALLTKPHAGNRLGHTGMHAAARERNHSFLWALLAETSQNCQKQLFKKTPSFETLSHSTRKAAGGQVRLVLLFLKFFQLNAPSSLVLHSLDSFASLNSVHFL